MESPERDVLYYIKEKRKMLEEKSDLCGGRSDGIFQPQSALPLSSGEPRSI